MDIRNINISSFLSCLQQQLHHHHQQHHHHHRNEDFTSPGGSTASSAGSPVNNPSVTDVVLLRQQSLSRQSRVGHFQGQQQQQLPSNGGSNSQHPPTNVHVQDPLCMELREIPAPPQQLQHQPPQNRPKQVMVSSNGIDGSNFHSLVKEPTSSNHPDLLDHRYQQQQQQQQHASPGKLPQPLNPAALVVPPTPPLQFPHQFPHLIHSRSGTLPHPVSRSHSCDNTIGAAAAAANPDKTPSPLLSPPAQFTESNQRNAGSNAPQFPGYVTLPRNHHHASSNGPSSSSGGGGRALQPKGSGQHVDWASFTGSGQKKPGSSSSLGNNCPIYDGVGPRTSATGATSGASTGERGINFTLNRPCPTIPEINESHHQRDSSGSEVTIVDDNLSGFCEPFGKAQPPPLSALRGKNRDSIASSADSDMDGMLASSSGGSSSGGSSGNGSSCRPQAQLRGGQQQQKQLKGILKGGSMNKRSMSYDSSCVNTPANAAAFHPIRKQTSKSASTPQNVPPPPKTLPKPLSKKTTTTALDV